MSTDCFSLSVFESRSLLETANENKRYVIQYSDNATTILIVVIRNIRYTFNLPMNTKIRFALESPGRHNFYFFYGMHTISEGLMRRITNN